MNQEDIASLLGLQDSAEPPPKTEWPVHYDHESALSSARAGMQTLRVILFPVDEDSPKLVYTECRVEPDSKVPGKKHHLLDFASLLQLSDDGTSASAHPAGPLEPSPPATRLYLAFDRNAASDGSPLNRAAGDTPMHWRGTLLGFRAYEPVDDLTQYMDVWAHDIRTFVNFLRRYQGPLEGRPLVRPVEEAVEEVVVEAAEPEPEQSAETKDASPQSSSETLNAGDPSKAETAETEPEGDKKPPAPPGFSSAAAKHESKDDKETPQGATPDSRLSPPDVTVAPGVVLQAARTIQKRPMRSLWSIAASAGTLLSSGYLTPFSGRGS
ncbi:hypothetical protein OH77DRAFT_739096 [Trametes cingulata]|nr:hypothetical protein OH77DRAFT_739096 [Trametes cingulata]